MRFESSEFVDSRVDIDGHEHVGCRSSAARCRISGGDLPALINNNFDACRWEFSEAAARTVAFRQAMYHGAGEGGRRLVDETIEGLYRRRILVGLGVIPLMSDLHRVDANRAHSGVEPPDGDLGAEPDPRPHDRTPGRR